MRKGLGCSLAIAVAAASAAVAVGTAAPQALASTSDCLWAGSSYSAGTIVAANGFGYTCHNDSATGDAYWVYSATAPSDAVAVPGWSDTDITPTSQFSPGAEVVWGGDLFTPEAGAGWNDLGPAENFGIGNSGDGSGGGVGGIQP
jgi:hypothetical protein